MTIQRDSKNQPYVDVENLRITGVSNNTRDPDKQWGQSDMIRFQAYKGDGTKALHMGAEIPVQSANDLLGIIQGMIAVHETLRKLETFSD